MELLPDDTVLWVVGQSGDGCIVVDEDIRLLFRGRDSA